MKVTDGEKLILLMLSELYDSLKVQGEIEPDFIRSAIFSDKMWSIPWKYSGIPFEHEETPELVKEVLNILDMWSFIENEDEGELAEISSKLSKKINNLSLLFLNKTKIERLKSEDTVFYHSLIFGSIIISGRENGDKIF